MSTTLYISLAILYIPYTGSGEDDPTAVGHRWTLHAAEELAEGKLKWAANAWIHLRDFRSPWAKGLTG